MSSISKVCYLSKEEIKEINKYLRSKGHVPFSAKELKVLEEDLLGVCHAFDEFAVRGMILPCFSHRAIVLRSAYAYTEVLVIQEKDNKPVLIGDRFDVVACVFEGENEDESFD